MSQNAQFTSADASWDKLTAINPHLLISRSITIVSGQNLARGALLGKITASGKYTLSASAAVDGSQVPDLVLAEDCDATSGDKTGIAYSRGDFNESALVLGAGHTADSTREGLRAKGITLLKPIPA
jgi:hypothetical protein